MYQEQPLGITSQGLPTPTASVQDGQMRAMNSAQGERVKNSKKASVTTQPGANEEHI